MARFVYKPKHPQASKNGFIPIELDEPPIMGKRELQIIKDIEPFKSPIDGSIISSRSQIRDHEKKHGVKQVGNDWSGSTKPKWWDKRQEMARGRKVEI